jgi:F0F1-type ATP synthase assembly protein I
MAESTIQEMYHYVFVFVFLFWRKDHFLAGSGVFRGSEGWGVIVFLVLFQLAFARLYFFFFLVFWNWVFFCSVAWVALDGKMC